MGKLNLTTFLCLIDFYFELLMSLFVFHFHKNEKPNRVYFSFFVFMKEFENELLERSRLTLWLFSQVWCTCYSKASLCQVP